MDEPYSTLEEYAELLRIACEKPKRIEAHTCRYCDQILIEFPENTNSTFIDEDTNISLRISLPKSVWESGGRKDCPFSENLPTFSNGDIDGSSLSVTADIARNDMFSTGSLTELAYEVGGQQNERYGEIVNVVCDEGQNWSILFESDTHD